MSKKLLSTLIASLFVSAPALAQSDEPFQMRGTFSIGGIYNNQSAQDPTRLEEYQDLGNGALSNFGITGRGGKNWIDAYGENFGRKDQYMFVRGGTYDLFKYGAYYNEMPHNFGFNLITPYVGVGTNTLTARFPSIDSSAWHSYDLGYLRKDFGGFGEWQGLSPWYFRVDGNEVKFDGTKVGSAANGTSPGNGFVDLPFPVQYKTSNAGVEGGYQTNQFTVALRWDYSKFTNGNDVLDWTNPYFGGNNLDRTYLPPENEFNKFTLTGNLRQLPWNSVLSARYTYAETKSSVDLGTFALNGPPAVYSPTNPDIGTFDGKYVNQSFAFAWTANPMQGLDSRVYYYWTKMENKSDLVEYGDAPTKPLASGLGCGNFGTPPVIPPIVGNCENELFHYTKNNVGLDLWWRFAKGQRLGGGWDYLDLDQERVDYDHMKWNKFWVEYKNTMLDNLAARVKYQYIDRTSSSNYSNAGVSPSDPNYLSPYTSAFDMQAMHGNWWKVTLDWTPAPLWGLAFEGIWKDNDYQDHTYGRASDKRQEYYVTASYGDANSWRVNAFADWEEIKYPSDHRYIGTVSSGTGVAPNTLPAGWCATTNLNCYSPFAVPNSGSYNWSSGTKDKNWAVGVALDVPVTAQFLVKASYIYFETNGNADFSVQDLNGAAIPGVIQPININNFDDSKRQSFNLKGVYAYNKNWSFTLGYAYEKWEYDDVSYNGYQYFVPYPPVASNTSLSYLNGYNAFTNGHQNIVYGLVNYRF